MGLGADCSTFNMVGSIFVTRLDSSALFKSLTCVFRTESITWFIQFIFERSAILFKINHLSLRIRRNFLERTWLNIIKRFPYSQVVNKLHSPYFPTLFPHRQCLFISKTFLHCEKVFGQNNKIKCNIKSEWNIKRGKQKNICKKGIKNFFLLLSQTNEHWTIELTATGFEPTTTSFVN